MLRRVNLPHPEAHFLLAAIGWLELGCLEDAVLEIDRIPAPWRTHPGVLDTEWHIHAKKQDWAEAYRCATTLVTLHPNQAGGWIHRAYAARRKPGGGLNQAFADLSPAAIRFPEEALIRYNLACYTAQLGELDEALRWLEEALLRQPKSEGAPSYKKMALSDEDLKPIWPKIRNLD
jgi:tetratricopeptide (TPR) repeat protein